MQKKNEHIHGGDMTNTNQLFKTEVALATRLSIEPTDILDPNDLFFIQKLIKLGFKDDDILIKYELHLRQPVLDYITRMRRSK